MTTTMDLDIIGDVVFYYIHKHLAPGQIAIVEQEIAHPPSVIQALHLLSAKEAEEMLLDISSSVNEDTQMDQTAKHNQTYNLASFRLENRTDNSASFQTDMCDSSFSGRESFTVVGAPDALFTIFRNHVTRINENQKKFDKTSYDASFQTAENEIKRFFAANPTKKRPNDQGEQPSKQAKPEIIDLSTEEENEN